MIRMLTEKAFNQAREFLNNQARPLEAARFRFHFEKGPADAVVEELQTYQNQDGGFGHALEPDFRASTSSILCTSIAFQIFREIQLSSNSEILQRAIAYCIQTCERGNWPIIPKKVEEGTPCAPWWAQSDSDNQDSDDHDNQSVCEALSDAFSLNPSAEMLGYLYDYQSLVPSDLILDVTERLIAYLSPQDRIEMHDLLCCLRLMQTKELPLELSDCIRQTLPSLITNAINNDPEAWKGYGLRPLQVIDRPESPFMNGLENVVAVNLDYEINTQQPNGAWTPTWSWGGDFPDAWAIAYEDWAGMLTLEKLLVLRRFNRIKGVVA